MKSDTEKYGAFYREMLDLGIYLAPSQFEGAFVSAAHSDEDLARTLEMTERSFKKVQK
jgi:glutamate-1-semialdehyde 2,1-aminomutase